VYCQQTKNIFEATISQEKYYEESKRTMSDNLLLTLHLGSVKSRIHAQKLCGTCFEISSLYPINLGFMPTKVVFKVLFLTFNKIFLTSCHLSAEK